MLKLAFLKPLPHYFITRGQSHEVIVNTSERAF